MFVWPAAEFVPVADELERVLERLGLLHVTLAVAAA